MLFIVRIIVVYLKRFAQSAGPGSASFLTRFMSVECLLESLLPLDPHFWSSLATLFASRTRLERQGCHRWRQGAKCKYKTINMFLDTTFDTFLTHFQDKRHFFHVFSRRCSSHAFLVYLCTFSDDFSTHFVCHVICARSDLDCTGMAQTHVLTFERPEKRQKQKQKSIAILNYMFSGFWHHFGYMFWRKSDFLKQMVVYKIVCEKGAPKRWNR